MSKLKFIDFFAGIGGFRLGMEQAGHECVGFCEQDKFAIKSYRAMHDTEGEWFADDIRTIAATDLPRADVWTAGFPCQDISIAGKQLGFRGERSSLFFTITGLIKRLEEKDRPKYLLFENVKNLLSVNRGFDFARLLIELAEVGYNVEWDVLDSIEVVPQHRERTYLVGHLRGQCTEKIFPITANDRPTNKLQGQYVNTITARSGNNNTVGSYVVEGEQHEQKAGRKLAPELYVKEATKRGYAVAYPGDSIDVAFPNSNSRRGRVSRGKSHTLTCASLQAIYLHNGNLRKFTPLENFRLQGFPDEMFYRAKYLSKEWSFEDTQKTSDSQLYRQNGNSVTVPVIYEIARRMK